MKQFISSVVPSESSSAVAVNFNVYTMARLCKYFLTIGNHKNHGEKDTTHYDKNTRVVHKPTNPNSLARSIGRLNYGSIASHSINVKKVQDKIDYQCS